MKRLKLLTAALVIMSLLLSICPQAFAATFGWVTANPIVEGYVYYSCEHGLVLHDSDFRTALLDINGNVIIPFDRGYQEIQFLDRKAGYITYIDAANNAGVMDMKGNTIVRPGLYDFVAARVDDYVYLVQKLIPTEEEGWYDAEFGMGDVNGNMIIPFGKYAYMEPFDHGNICVHDQDYQFVGLYNSAGQPIIPIDYGYTAIYATPSPYRYVAGNETGYYIVDNTAQVITKLPGDFLNAYDFENYILAGAYENPTIYDINGNVLGSISSVENEFIKEGYIRNYETNMVSDLYGNIRIAPNLYTDLNFLDDKYIIAQNADHQSALIDINGNVLIPFGGMDGSRYDIEGIYEDKYIVEYEKVKDIYGNVLFETDGYIEYLGNGYILVELPDANGNNNYPIKIARVEGEPVKPAAPAAPAVNVVVNGAPVTFADQPPVISEGRTLLPLRAVFDLLGATIEWDGATQTVYAKKDGIDITLTIGSDQLWVNGQAKQLDVRAQIMNGRTMVPVRAVADAFGCGIGWDAATYTVTITTN